MTQFNKFPRWRILGLGAICGLIFSCIVQIAIRLDYEYSQVELQEIANRSNMIIDIAEPHFDWFIIPATSLVIFSLASYAVHRIYAKRIKSLVLLWGIVGFVAGGVPFLVGYANNRVMRLIGNFEHYREYGNWGELPSVFGVPRLEVALLILAIIFGLLFGATIKLSLCQYSEGKKPDSM
jgi:hypothetical protein